jgi:hypothetical protein
MTRKRLKVSIIPVLLFATAFIMVSIYSFSKEPDEAIITAYDAYAIVSSAKGESFGEVELRAKLEKDGALNINPDIESETLSFYVGGKLIGKAVTVEDGFAKVSYKPDGMKSVFMTTKLEGSKKYTAKENSALIYFIDDVKPTIICDIDWTVSDTDKSSLILKSSDDESMPLKDSAEILTELTKHYNFIFITGREDAFLHKTREWLSKWKFPRLPVLYADLGQTPYVRQSKYKEEAVAKVKSEVKHVIAGIGDRSYDAEAYLKSGLKAFIIKEKGSIPKGAIRVSGWQELKKELMKEEYTKIK